MQAENLARFFHTTYEELAPQFNYQTRKASAVPWQDVPENNKRLMIAVAEQVIALFEAEARAGRFPAVDWEERAEAEAWKRMEEENPKQTGSDPNDLGNVGPWYQDES